MSTKRILLVEDDASVGPLIREHLSSLGADYEVEYARSAEDALRETELGAWDLVVTDNRMPGISGLELIKTLRDKAPTTRTILITAYGSEEVEHQARQLNVYHYLTKPFALAELSRVIKSAFPVQPGNDGGAVATAPPPDPGARRSVKVTLAGDGAVGKTSMIYRLRTEQFDAKRTMTIGVEFHVYDVQQRSSPTRMIVWDVGGQDHFAFTRRAFYRGSKAVGLVYDASNRKSFERLERWNAEIRASLPSVPIVLAGNKIDLPREVTFEEGRAAAEQWHVPFFETSCVSGEGIQDFFHAVAGASVSSAPAV